MELLLLLLLSLTRDTFFSDRTSDLSTASS
jgi:hypothetical protein